MDNDGPRPGATPGSQPFSVGHAVAGSWLTQSQTWLYEQVRRLPPHVRSHVFCESTEHLDQFPVPNIHTMAGAPGVGVDRLLRKLKLRRHWGFVARGLKRQKVDLLHSHFGWLGWENCRVADRLRIPHVVSFYGMDVDYLPHQGWGWAERYPEVFARADRVLVEGPQLGACVRRLGCPEAKIRVQHLGVAVDEIPYEPRTWNGGPLRVLMAATFREKKGLPFGLEALARIRDEVNLEITVIGDAGARPHEQDERRKIQTVIDKHRLAPITRMLGFVPRRQLFEEAYRHHAFLAPSATTDCGDTEGGAPLGLIEMAATGMVVVGSRHRDIPEVILDGKTGLLANERDVDGLAEQLRRVAGDPGAWPAMTRAGRDRIEQAFHSGRQGIKLAELYAELVTRRREPRQP